MSTYVFDLDGTLCHTESNADGHGMRYYEATPFYDRIEVVQKWNIQVRKSVKVMEEQADGSKKELSRRFYRNTYTPYLSGKNPDGSLDFVDRAKYMIKSGGENIYPAEIERILLSDRRISYAAVIKKADDEWGEIPVAFISRNDKHLTTTDIELICRANLASNKRPKEVYFIKLSEFPRSTTGKIQRHDLETWLKTIAPGTQKGCKIRTVGKSNTEKKYVPNFLIDRKESNLDKTNLSKGLKLVGDFLEKNVLKPNNINYPVARLEFINLFK